MNRRAVIKDLIIVAGAFALAPSCVQQAGGTSIVLRHFTISNMQEQLLKAVASAIIPPTDTPGAGELGCHLFALKMLDDCYDKNDQDAFIRGLNNFDAYAKTAFDHSFLNCTQKQQQQILGDIEEKRTTNADMASFYQTMKEKTIQGYLTSQYVLTNINKYEFIPAEHYNGYAPVKS